MVHGINGPNGISNDINIKLNSVRQTQTTSTSSTWGSGFASSSSVSIERNIPGLEHLMSKFDFEPPPYQKNIAQLTIDDKYYIPDQPFVENELCEV